MDCILCNFYFHSAQKATELATEEICVEQVSGFMGSDMSAKIEKEIVQLRIAVYAELYEIRIIG